MFVLYVFVLYITFFFKHAQFDLEVYAPRKESDYELIFALSVMEIQVCKEIAYFPGVTRH